MQKHPNEFTRRQILRHFAGQGLDVEVAAVESGYVVFFHRFSAVEASTVEDPAGKLIFNPERDLWLLYWMSGRSRWHLYDRYPKLHHALEAMLSEQAANLFHNVL